MLDSLRHTFRNWLKFSGRASRREYWVFALFYFLFDLAIAYYRSRGDIRRDLIWVAVIFTVVVIVLAVFLFIVYLSVSVRRLHDSGRDGAYILIHFIPFVGPFLILYFMILKGDESENHYGPPPGSQSASDSVTPPKPSAPYVVPTRSETTDSSMDSLLGPNYFGKFS